MTGTRFFGSIIAIVTRTIRSLRTGVAFSFTVFLVFYPQAQSFAKTVPQLPVFVELYRYGQVEKKADSYRIGKKSGVFLKIQTEGNSRCLYLDQPGEYHRDRLSRKVDKPAKLTELFSCNLRALALRIKTPAQVILTPQPRGDEVEGFPNARFFESIWQQIVIKKGGDIPPENLLAAALWFYRSEKNPARTAYILEQAYQNTQNTWFLKLHHDAYAETSPAQIEQEVESTLNSVSALYSPRNNVALLIGIQNYEDGSGWTDLKTPINDINRLKNVLVTEYGFNHSDIYLLPDASYQDLLDAIGELRQKVNERTNLLIYYAGHGWVDEDGEYFWIPSDGHQSPKTWVYTDYILKKIRSFNSLHTLFMVDSCFGGALNSHTSRGPTNEGIRKLYQKRSRQLVTAGGNEPVADRGSSNNSVFAGALLEILENQPEDQPLSVQELFSKLQPRAVANSNQTPTYDRITDSRDEWGQFYFIKDWKSVSLLPATESADPVEPWKPTTTFREDILESIYIPQPMEATKNVKGLQLLRGESVVTINSILENEPFSMMGGGLSFDVNIKNRPLLLQLKYLVHQGQEYADEVPRSLNRTEFQMGLRSLETKQNDDWRFEFGLSYNWDRFQIEWDTSRLANKKANNEFIIIGYHLLAFENFSAVKLDDSSEFGLNYDFQFGVVNFSGSTGIAVSETYNKDVSSFILGAKVAPELRYEFSAVNLELRLGAAYEYLWQPFDNDGGSQVGNNHINTTQKAYQLYVLLNLAF